MKNNSNENSVILGQIGEKIVSNLLCRLGHVVQESIDPFDSQKDMTSDDKLIEVKTQQPFVLKNSFSFKLNQLRKCRNVDELYFVSIPPLMNKKYKWGGWIFKVNPKEFVTTIYTTKHGLEMILIKIEQESVQPFYKMTNEECNELCKYAQSSY